MAHPQSYAADNRGGSVRAFGALVGVLLREKRADIALARRKGLEPNNRELWECVLFGRLTVACTDAAVLRIVAWYLSITDTTGPVERNHGRLT